MRIGPFVLMAGLLVVGCKKDPSSVKNLTFTNQLESLPGVEIEELEPLEGFLNSYRLLVTQPVDHNLPNGPTFQQEIYLSHLGYDRPVMIETNGYDIARNALRELTTMLNSNQVLVTHRFFPDARPEPLDWQYLTIRQAANDHHRIIRLLKEIYPGVWVSSGRSKGGMAATFHRRFFPDDVDATVAYVAPFMIAEEDPRFDQYLMYEAGTAECRGKIYRFQRSLLENREQLLPFMVEYERQWNLGFSLGREVVFEYAVLEFPFAYWQYSDGNCTLIPDKSASARELFDFLDLYVPLYIYSDLGIYYYEPLFYQAFTEFGYYGFITNGFEDLLQAAPNPTNKTFAPQNVPMSYDPSVMQDIVSWVQSNGDKIIFIYGEIDTWSAAAIELTDQTNRLKITQPGASHRVNISELDEQALLISTLQSWLGIEVNPPLFAKQSIIRFEFPLLLRD